MAFDSIGTDSLTYSFSLDEKQKRQQLSYGLNVFRFRK